MDTAKRLISRYFSENYCSSCVFHLDNEKIILQDTDFGSKMLLPFSKGTSFAEIVAEMHEYSNEEEKYSYIADVLPDIVAWAELSSNNEKLSIFEDSGYKLGANVEFILNYSILDNECGTLQDNGDTDNFDMFDFTIDGVKVKIGYPSDFFELIFHEYEDDDYHVGWDAYKTIRLIGVTSDNYKTVLQQALFLIHEVCPSSYDFDYPSIGALCWEYIESEKEYGEDGEYRNLFHNELKTKSFLHSQFSEPIALYNAGRSANDVDAAFLYHYRILEYFFFFAQSDEIKTDVDKFNSDGDMNGLIKRLQTNYFGQQEDKLLLLLLKTLPSVVYQPFVDRADANGFIMSNDLGLFCDALYKHRNSIVHGKYEFKSHEIKLPDMFKSTVSRFWLDCVHIISHHLIMNFCYGKDYLPSTGE